MDVNERIREFQLESTRVLAQGARCLVELERFRDNIADALLAFENSTDTTEYRTYFETVFVLGFCDCQRRLFSDDLRNLFHYIMSRNSENSMWNAFESFIKKYGSNYHRLFSNEDIVCTKICSVKFCHALLAEIDAGVRHEIALPVILKNAMSTMCVENFGNISGCVTEYLQNRLRSSKSGRKCEILSALSGHSDFVNSLVNFGFISSTKDDLWGFERDSYCNIRCFMRKWSDSHKNANKIMSLTEKSFFHYKSEERFKRTFWATVAIRAIQMNLENFTGRAEKFIHYLKVYFAATTDPFLTIFEVRSLLYACFTVLEKLDLFDIYCQEFDKLMPECPVDVEPRKLTDLTRCQVRKNLNNCSLPLPSAVDQLHLPDAIQSFVLGNITNISRKRKNDSSQEAVTSSKLAKFFSQ